MKKILLIALLAITSFSSCKKNEKIEDVNFSHNIKLESGTFDGDILFKETTIETTLYLDNVLEETFSFKIENNGKKSKRITISNLKLYGNNKLLNYKIYSGFEYESKEKEEAFEGEVILKPGENKTFTYLFLIPYGNEDAHYDVICDMNNVKLDIKYYEGNDTNFTYIHDPRLNEKAMSDVIYDEDAIYGYIPSQTGTLSQYIDYAWNNEESAKGYREERIKYHKSNNENIRALEKKLREEGKNIEEIARACSALRNQNRLDMYDNEDDLKVVKERNLQTYGNELGPTPEYLYDKYGSWEKVLEKSYSINVGMDACCGLYDDYFEYYNLPIPSYIEEV